MKMRRAKFQCRNTRPTNEIQITLTSSFDPDWAMPPSNSRRSSPGGGHILSRAPPPPTPTDHHSGRCEPAPRVRLPRNKRSRGSGEKHGSENTDLRIHNPGNQHPSQDSGTLPQSNRHLVHLNTQIVLSCSKPSLRWRRLRFRSSRMRDEPLPLLPGFSQIPNIQIQRSVQPGLTR